MTKIKKLQPEQKLKWTKVEKLTEVEFLKLKNIYLQKAILDHELEKTGEAINKLQEEHRNMIQAICEAKGKTLADIANDGLNLTDGTITFK